MTPVTIAALMFGCVFGAALLGMRLRLALPEHHLADDTKDAVRIGMGLVATMTALILGLLIASAKGSYDTQKSEMMQMAAKITYLDRMLVNYGPETADARQLLCHAVDAALHRVWPEDGRSANVAGAAADPNPVWSAALPQAVYGSFS